VQVSCIESLTHSSLSSTILHVNGSMEPTGSLSSPARDYSDRGVTPLNQRGGAWPCTLPALCSLYRRYKHQAKACHTNHSNFCYGNSTGPSTYAETPTESQSYSAVTLRGIASTSWRNCNTLVNTVQKVRVCRSRLSKLAKSSNRPQVVNPLWAIVRRESMFYVGMARKHPMHGYGTPATLQRLAMYPSLRRFVARPERSILGWLTDGSRVYGYICPEEATSQGAC
jgi:hypothetical protein